MSLHVDSSAEMFVNWLYETEYHGAWFHCDVEKKVHVFAWICLFSNISL